MNASCIRCDGIKHLTMLLPFHDLKEFRIRRLEAAIQRIRCGGRGT